MKPQPTLAARDPRAALVIGEHITGPSRQVGTGNHSSLAGHFGVSEVDEVVAETFLVAWRRLEEVPSLALPWLLGVAGGVALNLPGSAQPLGVRRCASAWRWRGASYAQVARQRGG